MKKDRHFDAKLVKAYQSGDQKALTALVQRWHLTFCKKAYWIVKDAEISKDIAQDTWQTIINKIDTLKEASSFSNWAMQIVYSKALDVLRKQSKALNENNRYSREQDLVIVEKNDKSILKSKLLKAIKSLPEKQQIVIKLFYLEEYSLKEISKTLDISMGTAKSRLFYAREELKKTLK